MGEPEPVTEDELRRLCEFLYRRTGMIFSETKRYYIQRRVSERMAAVGATSFASYFARLRSDVRGEVEQFINAFTVNETYFYREDHQLRCLTTDLLAERTRAKAPGGAIRIWSIPCSTGEEPYSVAMWLLVTRAGMEPVGRAWRRSTLRKVSPSICGMFTSTMRRSTGAGRSFSSASRPFRASLTS